MSLLEWLLEPANPGPVGTVKVNTPDPDNKGRRPQKWLVWVAMVAGLILVSVSLYGVFYEAGDGGIQPVLIKLSCLVAYMLIGHFVDATPDYTNVGWLGGLIDNPFRISDDFNRLLLFTQALLLPGKLMAYSLIITWLIGKRLYKKLKK
ncbi:hypothetical protein BWI97_22625 [Siphonobacter sp. BAB-5405]|uniref:hypothetical protein n=1 Tax=Siphonobacter sp. BAB-5405 TaxID=1864825 RepID=UPI000C7FF896|nr:hypothetical protein [Siphonobacter sp. BAB-5405]PMD90772.1 hypothetical protein BWI97_22625 [Siphonobacter sp. BAB-5405]